MKGFVERMKKSKVMGKLMRSVSSKSSKLMNSLTPSTQKKATSKPAKLTISSATQQKLVVTTTNSVMGVQAEMMEQKMTVVPRGPTTPKPSDGRKGSIHGSTH
uniref:Uncharacterized protein n=1 Tax=Opuntia streptacantha TaxID=393608 RepID=A0A7C9CUU3_OPUST